MTAAVSGQIVRVQTGVPRPFGPNGVPSSIRRAPVNTSVAVHTLGLAGDSVGDTVHHGGPDKAVHAYPVAHYDAWRRDLPEASTHFADGSFGENLTVDGLTEPDICIGDCFASGALRLQVSQARQPCWKLNVRFARRNMARLVQDSGRTGWYFRVLAPGEIAAGGSLTLIARPNPDWPLDRVWRLLYRTPTGDGRLREFAALEGLSAGWRALANRRLESHRIEDWSLRLDG